MKIMTIALVLILVSSLPNWAQDVLDEIIDSKTVDWNRDGDPDRITLLYNKNLGTVIAQFYLGKNQTFKLIHSVSDLAVPDSTGNIDDITIELGNNNSAKINSKLKGYGIRQYETLTISYRQGDLVVAGYDYSTLDPLQRDSKITCSYNILTGKIIINDKIKYVKPQTIKIADWMSLGDEAQCYY